MGIYSRAIFPYIVELVMNDPLINDDRKETLAKIKGGEILEIGFGTGLNLPHYPVHVQKITIVDVNSGMHRLAKKRVATSSIAVEQHIINAELLPFADNSFDHVVSTWTLCSIENIAQALREVRRVLKPKGEFLFVEHGQSPELEVQTWQNRLNPLQRIIGDGCNLNRNIEMLIKEQGFEITHLERFYKDKIFKILGYTYKGIAIKS